MRPSSPKPDLDVRPLRARRVKDCNDVVVTDGEDYRIYFRSDGSLKATLVCNRLYRTWNPGHVPQSVIRRATEWARVILFPS